VVLAHLNNISYNISTMNVPTLLDRVRAGVTKFPKSQHVIEIDFGVIDLILNNHDTGQHPIHLHGHHFWVLGTGQSNVGDYSSSKHDEQLNFNDPPSRDTSSINMGSWLYLRFVADNPGVWLLHCHIGWHTQAGFVLTFIEGREHLIREQGALSKKHLQICPDPGHKSHGRDDHKGHHGDDYKGYREDDDKGHRGDDDKGYREDDDKGYRGDDHKGYREDDDKGHHGDDDKGYRGDDYKGYREDDDKGHHGDDDKGYRGDDEHRRDDDDEGHRGDDDDKGHRGDDDDKGQRGDDDDEGQRGDDDDDG